MRKTGTHQILGKVNHFIPYPLPPKNPPLQLSAALLQEYEQAMVMIGKLNGIASHIPDQKRFVKAYVIKEALLSSSIEGIHTTMLDVFTQPLSADQVIPKDTQLVLNYSKALDVSLEMVQGQGYPIVSRVILTAHEVLMTAGDGDKSSPGMYRKQSVQVGQHVPAPAPEIPGLMADLERYINESDDLPHLIKAGLAHVQFETIHPFLDGNGRIGRLLIVLMLVDNGILSAPILYPSYYFKKQHAQYYVALDRVRSHGDFEGWILFYLQAIHQSAKDAYERAVLLEKFEKELVVKVERADCFAKNQELAQQVVQLLFEHPILDVTYLAKATGKAYNTVKNVIVDLVDLGIVSENQEQKRNKQYIFVDYLELLEKEL